MQAVVLNERSIYQLGGDNMRIGKLIQSLNFEFESYIIVEDGELYPEPYNEIYERCGPVSMHLGIESFVFISRSISDSLTYCFISPLV